MPHFNESQLEELERVFGLKRAPNPDPLPCRDGHVSWEAKVWWRGEDGPELVTANGSHWGNLHRYPDVYSLAMPKVQTKFVKYLD